MLENASMMKRTALGSRLGETSMIRPHGGRKGRSMTAALMLTSLVDAFSILVIFLIMTNASNSDVVNTDKIQLPTAKMSELINTGIVVRVEAGRVLVEDKVVAKSDLINTFKQLNATVGATKRDGLIIVADKAMDYEALSPVILAGSQAGITKYKFAVVRKD